ncbi:DUF6965 family protein [Pedobacter aquatilis]|uniref:DUF6965 family protein n=1 Tax=Pedobacter aquatilis TaxID=351343 RepID=UPI002930A8DC|nr:hypothetical protein [Pedobacter aquatilis]
MTIAELNELETFFANAEKQATPIYLNEATIITDYDHFLESHLAPLRHDLESKVNQPLIWRLKALKLIVEANG